jgi:hypothetical protein
MGSQVTRGAGCKLKVNRIHYVQREHAPFRKKNEAHSFSRTIYFPSTLGVQFATRGDGLTKFSAAAVSGGLRSRQRDTIAGQVQGGRRRIRRLRSTTNFGSQESGESSPQSDPFTRMTNMEGEASDVLGRDYYEHGAQPGTYQTLSHPANALLFCSTLETPVLIFIDCFSNQNRTRGKQQCPFRSMVKA